MLILVAVTINVAMQGGLFTKAKTAADQTQREADREELLSAIIGAMDYNTGEVKFENLVKDLGISWNPGGDSLPCTFTKTKTGNSFTVDIEGNITEGESEKPIPPEERTSFSYNKTYSQTLNTDEGQLTANLYIVEGKNRAIFELKVVQGNANDYVFNNAFNYTYDQETKTLTTKNSDLIYNQEDNSFSYSYYGEYNFDSMVETNSSIAEWYTTAYDENLGVYTGVYYNKDVDKHIEIGSGIYNGTYVCHVHGDDPNISLTATYTSILSESNISVGESNDTIIYEGNTYTLLTDLLH